MWVVPGRIAVPSRSASPDERHLERDQRFVEPVDRATRPQSQVRGDLIVARATRLQLPGHGADPLGERRLEVEVDVLELGIPGHRPIGDGRGQALQPADQLPDLGIGQQPGPPQGVDMGDRSRDVVGRELTVEIDRTGEIGHSPVVLFREPATPQAHAPLLGVPSC